MTDTEPLDLDAAEKIAAAIDQAGPLETAASEHIFDLIAEVRRLREERELISAAVAAGTYSNREIRGAIQYIANVIDRTDTREPRVSCFCGGEHITGSCLIRGTEEKNR